MPKTRVFSENEKHKILSLYAQGVPIKHIGKEMCSTYNTIKKFLKNLGVYKDNPDKLLYRKKCCICGKLFWSYSSRSRYCNDPCGSQYDKSTTSFMGCMRYHYVKIMRCDLWKIIKSNPKKAIKIRDKMIKEEGEEFTKLIFGKMFETDDFEEMMKIYEKYEDVFNEDDK